MPFNVYTTCYYDDEPAEDQGLSHDEVDALYHAGFEAQCAGKPRSACPYSEGKREEDADKEYEWLDGYDQAEENQELADAQEQA